MFTRRVILSAVLAAWPLFSADLRQAVDGYVAGPLAGQFSGTILIAQEERVRVLQSYGFAERNLGVRNQPDMLYRIGSLTKPFTAVGVLRLVQDGRIQLSDSIADRITSCPAAWKGVTIEELLDHTSGIPDLFNDLRAVPILETREETSRMIMASTRLALLSSPGTKYQYSNFNYVLLGILIEDVTGQSWETYLQERVFAQAGLKHTLYDDVWTVIPGRISGYVRKDGSIRPITYKDHSAYSAGGLLSSAIDVFQFSQALFRGDLLGSAMLAEMTRPRLGNYGLGLQIIELNGRTAYNHTGGIDGFSSHLQYYPQNRLTVVVLANTENDPVKKIATEIAALALNAK